MHLSMMIFIAFMNSVILGTNLNEFNLFDTSLASTEGSSVDSTATQSSSLSSKFVSTTTNQPYYPDTFNSGAIAGIVIGSLIFIFAISVGSYYIRRQQLYYLPYYNNYRSV